MDEIRQYCAQLYSERASLRDEAYAWLTKCKPFMQLSDVLRQQRYTVYQVARLVDPAARGPMSDLALALLAKLLAENGERENQGEHGETD